MVLALGKSRSKVEDIAEIGAAPTVDRLILVAHHADVAVLLGKQAHQLVLAAVGVLILVDHDVVEASIPGFACGVVVTQQANGLQQQIVEIERIGIAQRLFVLLVERRDGLGFLIDSLLIKIGRRPVSALFAWLMRESAARYCMKSFSSKPSVR